MVRAGPLGYGLVPDPTVGSDGCRKSTASRRRSTTLLRDCPKHSLWRFLLHLVCHLAAELGSGEVRQQGETGVYESTPVSGVEGCASHVSTRACRRRLPHQPGEVGGCEGGSPLGDAGVDSGQTRPCICRSTRKDARPGIPNGPESVVGHRYHLTQKSRHGSSNHSAWCAYTPCAEFLRTRSDVSAVSLDCGFRQFQQTLRRSKEIACLRFGDES